MQGTVGPHPAMLPAAQDEIVPAAQTLRTSATETDGAQEMRRPRWTKARSEA